MAKILVPLPSQDFDPTESAVPWRILTDRGHRVVFATPDGGPGRADPRMVTGVGLSVLAPILRADANGRSAYHAMAENREFLTPMTYDAIDAVSADALLLPGGHAVGCGHTSNRRCCSRSSQGSSPRTGRSRQSATACFWPRAAGGPTAAPCCMGGAPRAC
jgi:putative intracellular protease/amidase